MVQYALHETSNLGGSGCLDLSFCLVVSECYAFPSQNCTTAHFPLHAHFLAPESPPPPSVALISSSFPCGSPTMTSALDVLKASVLMPEDLPNGPMASSKGVVGFHEAWHYQQWTPDLSSITYISSQSPIVEVALEDHQLTVF